MNDNFALVDERLHWWWYSRWMNWLRDRSLAAADVNIGESIHKTAEPTKTQRCTHNVVQVGRIKLLCAWFFHMPVYSHFVARALLSCLFWCPIGRILILNRLPLFLLWNDIYHNITNPRKTSDWVDFIRRKVSERKNWIRMDWVWPKTNSVTTEKETCKFFACSEFVHREIRLSRNSYFDGLPLSSSSADEYPVKTFSQQRQRW